MDLASSKTSTGEPKLTIYTHSIRTILAAVASVIVLASPAHAVPVTYSEAVSGDLATFSNTTFMLGIGLNTISGTTGLTRDGWDSDSFRFVVPEGGTLDRIEVSMTLVSGYILTSSWSVFHSGYYGGPLLGNLSVNAPASDFLDGPFTGMNNIQATGQGASGNFDTGNYVFSMNVVDASAIPEPGTMALFGVGMLAALRTRRGLKNRARPAARA